MIYSVHVIDNDQEYKGTYEADSPRLLVQLVRKSPPIDNLYHYAATNIARIGKTYLCGLYEQDVFEEEEMLAETQDFRTIEQYCNGSQGIAIYFTIKNAPILNVLHEID